jgi:hypothetical protein
MSTPPNQPWDSTPHHAGNWSQGEGAAHETGGEAEEQSPSYESSPTSDYYYRPRRRVWPTVLVFLFLLSSGVVGFYAWKARDRASTDVAFLDEKGVEACEAFLEDLRASRMESAYRTTTPDFQSRMSQPQFDSYVQKAKDTLAEPFKTYKFKVPPLSFALFGQKVTGEYRATRKQVTGGEEEVFIKVIRDGDQICVDEFTVKR